MGEEFRLKLTFDDVLLEPRASGVLREEVRLETKLTKKISLKIPILAAAMDTISEDRMAIALGKLGGLAVLHRNCPIPKQMAMIKNVKRHKMLAAAAVGPADVERAKALNKAGCDVIVIDTAHAHHALAVKGAKQIKQAVKTQLIIGNIATREAAQELVKFADAVKVGVGPGSICTTRVVAGIGMPQLTAILEVAAVARQKNIPVIADGGMRYSGDIVKALAAGASSVMLGSMLAGTAETPGRVVKLKGRLVKIFRGMGSFEAMQTRLSSDRYFQKHARSYVPEGVSGVVAYKGPLKAVVEQIAGGIRTGMTYLGASKVEDIRKRARFFRITKAGLLESHPHDITITKKAPNY